VQPPYPEDLISLEELDRFLKKRAKVLGGVCITGGEPLIHANLNVLIRLIRSHGLKVKLDTNGTFPERLAEADVDYIAMDLKTTPEKYNTLLDPTKNTGTKKIEASVAYLKSAGIAYELRTTVVPGIVGPEELRSMLTLLQGAEKYVLTPFRPSNSLAANYTEMKRPSEEYINQLCKMVAEQRIPCTIRQ